MTSYEACNLTRYLLLPAGSQNYRLFGNITPRVGLLLKETERHLLSFSLVLNQTKCNLVSFSLLLNKTKRHLAKQNQIDGILTIRN